MRSSPTLAVQNDIPATLSRAMTLNPNPAHPSSLCYVVKLHRDSRPDRGQISGILEHVGTGHVVAFDDVGGLVATLLAHATPMVQASHRSDAGDAA